MKMGRLGLESSTLKTRGKKLKLCFDRILLPFVQTVSQFLYRIKILQEPLQFSSPGPFLHHLPSTRPQAIPDPDLALLVSHPVEPRGVCSGGAGGTETGGTTDSATMEKCPCSVVEHTLPVNKLVKFT
ncbi:hypothetical protein Hanom_Chr11g00992801 [Helianthus anomalus]